MFISHNRIVSTAVKLYNQAVELQDKRDAELSDVSFMKYFIIFDVQSKEDFDISHIKHLNCVSIPEDKLKPG